MVNTVTYPVAPAPTPLKGTLLDAATVSDGIDWLDGVGLYETYNCMEFLGSADFCAPTQDKSFTDGIPWIDGLRFAAYGGVKCRSVGLDQEDMLSQVTRVFNDGEHKAVEKALMENRFRVNAAGSGLPGSWTAPTDITPASGAVKAGLAVALLEGHAAKNYIGAPTIHMPRTIASLLLGVDGASMNGDTIETKLGSKIAAGGGYDEVNTSPAGAAPATGEVWVYVTGEVVVRKGPVNIKQAIDTGTNDVLVLAERGYIVAVDCFTAAVRVQVAS